MLSTPRIYVAYVFLRVKVARHDASMFVEIYRCLPSVHKVWFALAGKVLACCNPFLGFRLAFYGCLLAAFAPARFLLQTLIRRVRRKR